MKTQTSLIDPSPKRLRPSSIDIKNVQGIEGAKIEFGPNYTIFKGKNGLGKSSLLHAIGNVVMGSAALSGIARVIEGEYFEPEVTLVLKGIDGAAEERITKTAEKTPTIKSRIGTSAAFETRKKPGEYLRVISDQGADPAKFLNASAKEQVEMLLESLSLTWDDARVREILGEFAAVVDAEALPMEHLHPLQRIQAVRDSIFRARTGVNRDEKAKRSAADQTLRDAPAEIPEGLSDRIAEKRAEIATLQADLSGRQEAWRGRYREAESAATARRDAAIAAAKAAFDVEMGAANAKAAEDKAALTEATATLNAANTALSTLLRDQTDATKAQTMHETAAKFLADAESLKGKADRMTATIAALEAEKANMASDIPIEGLSISEGEIKIATVPLSQINTARRVAVAFSVATLRSKGLALRACFIDNMESLDDDHRAHLMRIAQAEGVYIFGAAVSSDDTLQIERG